MMRFSVSICPSWFASRCGESFVLQIHFALKHRRKVQDADDLPDRALLGFEDPSVLEQKIRPAVESRIDAVGVASVSAHSSRHTRFPGNASRLGPRQSVDVFHEEAGRPQGDLRISRLAARQLDHEAARNVPVRRLS